MRDSPGSVVTLLCSGIQLYSAERRIADCILNDVKWASVVTSAQLARASQSSEATVTRLCHKLGFDNYRKFQLALARDVMDQQETETQRSTSPDPLRQALQSVQANRQEEVRATIQALNLRQLRKAMSVLLITCDRRSPLAAQADHLLLASNRAQRIVATEPVPSLLSSALLVEVLYYLLLTEEDL